MNDAKLEQFLKLMFLEVFKARCSALSFKATLPPDILEAYEAAMRDFLVSDVNDALWNWFKMLRGENEGGRGLDREGQDNLWKSFREAEERSECTSRFEEEWKKLWDVL